MFLTFFFPIIILELIYQFVYGNNQEKKQKFKVEVRLCRFFIPKLLRKGCSFDYMSIHAIFQIDYFK